MHVKGNFKQVKYLSNLTFFSNFSLTDTYPYCEHIQHKIKHDINVGIVLYLKSVTLA